MNDKGGNVSIPIIRILLDKYKANVDQPDNHGRAPIHLAIQCGTVEGVQMLVNHGAKLNTPGESPVRYTPLQAAASNAALGNTENDFHKKYFEILNILLQGGAEPTIIGGQRQTPLQTVEAMKSSTNRTKVTQRLKEAEAEWRQKSP